MRKVHPRTQSLSAGLVVAGCACFVGVCRADPPFFRPIYANSDVHRISGDGRWGVGETYNFELMLSQAVRIELATLHVSILPADQEARALDVSDDGSVVVGAIGGKGCIWRGDSPPRLIGPLPPGATSADSLVISADGTTIAGRMNYPLASQAFIWTDPATGGLGVRMIGDLPGGGTVAGTISISADGRVVCGRSESASGPEAFRWTDPDFGGVGLQGLGDLPGGAFSSICTGVNGDGSVAVGQGSIAPTGHAEACVWTFDTGTPVVTGLGDPTNMAMAVSRSGSVIVGHDSLSLTGERRAFLWTPTRGKLNMKDWLVDHGVVEVQDWQLGYAVDISADGRTLICIGWPGVDPFINYVLVHLGNTLCPADLVSDGVVDFTDYLEFLNLFEAADPDADLNGDGVVDFNDYLEFLNQYDGGC